MLKSVEAVKHNMATFERLNLLDLPATIGGWLPQWICVHAYLQLLRTLIIIVKRNEVLVHIKETFLLLDHLIVLWQFFDSLDCSL